MLTMPKESSNEYTIIGIDPGTTFLGVGIIKVNLDTAKILSSDAFTLNGSKLINNDNWISKTYGDRTSRILALECELLKIFNYFKPTYICSESPFIMTKFPAAGIALTEVMCSIKRSVMSYSSWHRLFTIDPSSVKNAIGAKGNADKDVMRNKLVNLSELNYNGQVQLLSLDEHSIDALAVAYGLYVKIIKGEIYVF